MSSIPLLNDNEDEIRQSLSIEQIHIALTFLKKRFRSYTVKQIVQALNDYVIHKEATSMSIPISRGSMAISHVQQGLFLSHRNRPQIHQDRYHKSEQVRLVAKLYCESGINYSLAQFFFPGMSQKDYKSNLQLVAAQTLNSIEKYLSYQCTIQVQQLSAIQKKSVRQRLINIRDWMGKTNPEQLKTYMLFIERFYLNQSIQIEYKQAIQLYRVILQSVKGPQVDLGTSQTNRGLRQQLAVSNVAQQKSLTKEEQNSMILLFKQLCSVEKVSDAMCQKYKYDIKWSIHSIKNILKKIYKASLKKLAQTANVYLKKSVNLWFGYGDQDVMTLLQYENSLQTKIALLDFYTLKKITQLKLRQFIKKVNQFYLRHYQRQGVIYQTIPQECVSLPTLIIDQKPIEVINLVDQQKRAPKRQSCKVQTDLRQNKIMRKKRHWMEVVELDQSLRQDEIYLFPRNKNNKDKQDNDNTDIEDQQPARRQREIFKPKNINQKKDGIKQKETTKDKKDHKVNLSKSKVKEEEQPVSQKQQKNQKPSTLNNQSSVIKITKRPKLNSSFDSIESQPVRLSFYNQSDRSKGKRFDSKLKTRFKRKEIQQNNDKMELQN